LPTNYCSSSEGNVNLGKHRTDAIKELNSLPRTTDLGFVKFTEAMNKAMLVVWELDKENGLEKMMKANLSRRGLARSTMPCNPEKNSGEVNFRITVTVY